MKKHKTYREMAQYYDAICSWKDYSKDSKRLIEIIRRHKRSKGRDLLDIACGTGNHASYLKKHFTVTGLDLNREMLQIARAKHPDIRWILGDMTRFRLPQKFDVITCLFSSIAHAKTYATLQSVLKRFSKHLKPGGITVFEAYIDKKQFIPKRLHSMICDFEGGKVARFGRSKRIGNMAEMELHFLIGTKKGISYHKDVLQLGLFDPKRVLALLKNAGFKGIHIKGGTMKSWGFYKDRGFYVGIKDQ